MKTYYLEFLNNKHAKPTYSGFNVSESDIHPKLYPFQNAIVRWAVKLGKSSVFAERGLGKTFMELAWSTLVQQHTNKRVLLLNYLAVADQTIREAQKLGMEVIYCSDHSDVLKTPDDALIVTNYDRLKNFDTSIYGGVVLDESSILKNFTGKTKQALDDAFHDTPFKLCGTATPAPNDYLELGNHANFCHIMPANEMIMRWFKNDTMPAGNYSLKAHGKEDFYRWLTSWAVCLSHPRDLGDEYDIDGYDLPPLHIHEHVLPYNKEVLKKAYANGLLIPKNSVSATRLYEVKRQTLQGKVIKVAEIVEDIPENEPVILWVDSNDEAEAMLKIFPDALEVRGSHKRSVKKDRLKQSRCHPVGR